MFNIRIHYSLKINRIGEKKIVLNSYVTTNFAS